MLAVVYLEVIKVPVMGLLALPGAVKRLSSKSCLS